MREIKFRLRIHNKIVGYEKWYSGNFGEITSAKPCWLYSKDNVNWSPNYIYHTHKDQDTGRKDKNGKEVCEGDIVRWWTTKAEVIYKNEEFTTNVTPENDKPYWIACEVIGNIWENKELLK